MGGQMKINYKGKLVSPSSLSKRELAEYMMKAKPSHKGFKLATQAYLKK